MSMVDDGDDEQSEAHLASEKWGGLHDVQHDRAARHKNAVRARRQKRKYL